MLGDWFHHRGRQRLLATPFPPVWLAYLEMNVAHCRYLSESEQTKLFNDLRIFIAEKHWEGCGGLVLTDEIKVAVAAQACLLTLNMAHDFYPNVQSVLIYPGSYLAPKLERRRDGMVTRTKAHRLGEAWGFGPVVLSWWDAQAGGQNAADGRNLVFHEFAHQLDMGAGRADGVPRLLDEAAYERWAAVMTSEYAALVKQSKTGRATLLRQYGATNATEFFAVATEAFFEKPRQMRERHGQLYEVLRDYYRQDPAARVDSWRAVNLRPDDG